MFAEAFLFIESTAAHGVSSAVASRDNANPHLHCIGLSVNIIRDIQVQHAKGVLIDDFIFHIE